MVDNQGRCVITDHGQIVVFNLYGPAVTNEDADRFPFKMRFYQARLPGGFVDSGKPHFDPIIAAFLVSPIATPTVGRQSHDGACALVCMQVLQHRIESCLAAQRNVVVLGDLNIAAYAIDHCDYASAPAR